MIEKTSLKKDTRKLDFRPLIAFFVALVASVLMFTNVGVTPFGNRNILTSDLAAQYGPYLIGLRNTLKSGESIFYSQAQGMGQNTMGLFAYYLSSPMNIIVLLFPKNNIQEAITIMICFKMAFAGSFMTWLLDRKFKTGSKMTIVFGLMYPLCSFVLSFIFNIMWLDGIALLPLLIVFVEKFIEDRRCWPKLTLVLLLLFVSGYYMAYMIGIFSFFYLICVMGYQGKFSGEESKKHAKTVGWFILSAIVAAMISAVLLLPAGINTLSNGDYSVPSSLSMEPKFSLIDFIDQFMANGVPDLTDNLPFVFCGLTALLLFILFFMNKSICRKLRMGIAGVCIAFLLSFQMPVLDRIWQLFDEPNDFCFRYAYLFSFVMILTAFYSFLHLKEAGKKAFLCSYCIICMMCVLSQNFGAMSKSGNVFFATLILLTLETLLLFGTTLEEWPSQIANIRRYNKGFLVAVILIELVLFNTERYIPNLVGSNTDARDYSAMLDQLDTLADGIDRSVWSRTEMENSWHRFIQSNALPNYIDTNSISSFASMANKKANHFLKQFGYSVNYNYFCVNHLRANDPVDAMLGVRYIVTTDCHNELALTGQLDQYYLYENKYAMPIAYLVEADADSFDGYALEKDEHTKDYFTFQEKWIESLSGLDASDLYNTFGAEWEVFNGERTDIQPLDGTAIINTTENKLNNEQASCESEDLQIYYRSNAKCPMVLHTQVEITEDAPLYLLIPYPCLGYDLEIYVNNELSVQLERSCYSTVVDMGEYGTGEMVSIDIRVQNSAFACYDPIFAYCHLNSLDAHTSKLAATVSDIQVENGHVTLTASNDSDKLLFTSIPYEAGWEAWIDGQKVEIQAYQDAFLSIPVSAGQHRIELKFDPPGLKSGIVLSAAGALLYVILSFVITDHFTSKKEKQTIEESI